MWHPDVRACPLPSCELRGAPLRADLGPLSSLSSAPSCLPGHTSSGDVNGRVTGGLVQQGAGDGEADRLGRGAEGVAVHDDGVIHVSR